MTTRIVAIALALAALASPAASADRIEWLPSLEEALARAKEQNRVVFVAINMDGERANDWSAASLYRSPAVIEMAKRTVNVVANRSEHRNGMVDCERLGGIPCAVHRRVDVEIREKQYVKATPSGYVIAPQHVWIAPDGRILLSVPYQIFEPEILWCFVTALREIDAATEIEMPDDAQAPKRLVVADLFDPATEVRRPRRDPGPAKPAPESEPGPTREEILALVEEIRSDDAFRALVPETLTKLARSDQPEALTLVEASLAKARAGRRRDPDLLGAALRTIGETAPPNWWKTIAGCTGDRDETVRDESAVALEQLAASESLRVVSALLRKEKSERVKKNLLRALGTVTGEDSSGRQTLIKYATSHKSELLRTNALVALGAPESAADDDVRETLTKALSDGIPAVRAAAAAAMARSGYEAFRGSLAAQRANEQEADPLKAIDTAIAILDGKKGSSLARLIERAASDLIPRNRNN